MASALRGTMAESSEIIARPGHLVRWLIWLGFVTVWTAGLLSPQPVELAKRFLPEDSLFSSFKSAHVTCYALMAILSGWLRVTPSRRGWLLLFLSGHAFATELLQQFVPGRTTSFFDVLIDHVGVLIGLALTRKWWTS